MDQNWKAAIQSPDPQDRKRGIKMLVQSRDPKALQVLKWLFENDPDPGIREYAKKGAKFLYQKSLEQIPESETPPASSPKQEAIPQPAADSDPEPRIPPFDSTLGMSEPDLTPPEIQPPSPPESTTTAFSDPEPDGPDQDPVSIPPIMPSEPAEEIELPEGVSKKQANSASLKLQQALTQQMRGNQEKALKHFADALELNPSLKEDTFAQNLASSLTDLPAQQAIQHILSDEPAPSPLSPTTTEASFQPAVDPQSLPGGDFGKENKTEIAYRQYLELQIDPGERLLAYSGGIMTGLISSSQLAVGLTNKRLILLPIKRGKVVDPVRTIWRPYLESIEFSGLFSRMRIKVTGSALSLNPNKPFWKKRTKQLNEILKAIPKFSLDQNQIREQAKTMEELGLVNAALQIIQAAGIDEQPDQAGELSFQEKLKNSRFAHRAGAGFLFVNALLGLIAITGFVSAAIDILIGVYLWQGKTKPWAGWAILRAALGAVLFGILFISEGDYLFMLAQLSLSGSVILALVSKYDRLGTYTAIGIYVIGFLGITTVTIILSVISLLSTY
jgi:hypothetical protein